MSQQQQSMQSSQPNSASAVSQLVNPNNSLQTHQLVVGGQQQMPTSNPAPQPMFAATQPQLHGSNSSILPQSYVGAGQSVGAPSGMQHLLSGGPQIGGMSVGPPPQQMAMQVPPPQLQQDMRPLNVKDALTYLDQVKFQFSDQPDVYNRFLDIMKDFKSQAIDTPGVIERVSNLFRGHPSLIVGFNTFLPPGYKIEVTQTSAGQTYTITTPESQHYVNFYSGAPVNFPQAPSYPATQPGPGVQVPQMAPSEAVGAAKKTPVEFNHAINYVNKIKNRFVNEPEVYKQFLEILRTYQNESKPISEVYTQVQLLFRGNADLLEEFKQFLPDTSAPAAPAARQYQAPTSGLPAPQVQQYQAAPTGQQQQYGRQRSQVPTGPSKNGSFGPKGGKRIIPQGGLFQGAKSRFDFARGRGYSHQFGAAEEFEFFEKVKRVLGNKQTYIEFLKILNLFNQDIIDPKILVEKVEPFLARVPELLDWFKVYVRYDESNQPPEIFPTEPPSHDLADSKRSGSSYRLLPTNYVQPPCQGRDSLCYEVLNDNWTCHPTWASEDGGFVAHKKNQFEEALYRCEEERYEFDLNIEANKSVIQRLEPIAKRIADMTPEEARSFKLLDGLGDGLSKSILKRVIRKIYDKDRGQEVIESLLEHPAVAVPIVLKRLKQKDEEWRRNQREWSKIWREIDGKNFYKSLDHQGINFKVTDKKTTSSKALLTEIETIYREHHSRHEGSRGRHHIEYTINNREIMNDIKYLVLAYLDRSQYPTNEQERAHKFLNKFVAPFFNGPDASSNSDLSKDRNTLYGNNAYYLFFRFYQIAYSRLAKIREAAEDIAMTSAGYRRLQNQKVAQSLDLLTKRDSIPVEVDNGDIYKAFLALVEKVFENDIDPAIFEEQARFWFGTSAYVMYTVDRLFQHLAKQLVHIVTDPGCVKMFSLYLKEKAGGALDARRDSQYRRKADEIVDEEENIYKVEFHFDKDLLTIELLGDQEFAELDDSKNSEVQWTNYIDNYVKFGATGQQLQPRTRVFLNRTRTDPSKLDTAFDSINNLECKISVNTYKMFFVENSEDSFRRMKTFAEKPNADILLLMRKKRHIWMKKFLEKQANKVLGTSNAEWNRATQKLDKTLLQGPVGCDKANPVESVNVEVFGVPCRQFVSQSAMQM